MNKILIATVAALTLSAVAATSLPTLAAPSTGQGQHGGKLKKLSEALGLTDAQKAQIKPILQSARQQAQAIKQDTTLTPEQQKAKLRDIRRDTMQQVGAILTPEQREKLKDLRQHRQNG